MRLLGWCRASSQGTELADSEPLAVEGPVSVLGVCLRAIAVHVLFDRLAQNQGSYVLAQPLLFHPFDDVTPRLIAFGCVKSCLNNSIEE